MYQARHRATLTGMCPFSGWHLGQRPALDGARALAVLAVIIHHAGLLPAGYIGVDLFFALSGFLITSLLLEEHAATGRIRLLAFYRRRALRLFPALAVMVSAVTAFGMGVGLGPNWVTWTSAGAALFYLTNFALLDGHYSVLTHTWSLAIEEQFYLTWPLLLLVVVRRGRTAVLWTAATLAVAGAVWSHVVLGFGSRAHYAFGLDTRVATILAGCALAAWMHHSRNRRVHGSVIVALLVVLTALAVEPGLFAGWRIGVVAAVSTALVWAIATRDRVPALELPPLRWVGVRSYGIYLWHVPVLVIVDAFGMRGPALLAVVLAVTLMIAWASYTFVEAPFLRIKDRRPKCRKRPTTRR